MLLNRMSRNDQMTFRTMSPDEGAGAGAATPPAGASPAPDAGAGDTGIKKFLGDLKAKFSAPAGAAPVPPPIQAVTPPEPQGTTPVVSPYTELKRKASAGEEVTVHDFLEVIESQQAQLDEALGLSQEAAKATADMSTGQVIQNANIAANALTREFGIAVSHEDVLRAVQPFAGYIDQQYGPAAGSAQSLIETFRLAAGPHLARPAQPGVNSNPGGPSAPPLGVGTAGSAPAPKTMEAKINEAFRNGLKEK